MKNALKYLGLALLISTVFSLAFKPKEVNSLANIKLISPDSTTLSCPPDSYMMWSFMVNGWYVTTYQAYRINARRFGACWDVFVKDALFIPHTMQEFEEIYPGATDFPIIPPTEEEVQEAQTAEESGEPQPETHHRPKD